MPVLLLLFYSDSIQQRISVIDECVSDWNVKKGIKTRAKITVWQDLCLSHHHTPLGNEFPEFLKKKAEPFFLGPIFYSFSNLCLSQSSVTRLIIQKTLALSRETAYLVFCSSNKNG